MSKPIPFQFDAVVLSSPVQQVLGGEENTRGYRLNVGVFYKYKNRNGSYITDEYAESLIKSATRGNVPVIGFYDPETKEWASHTGPALACGYGYVESFIGWEPFTDTDGITRDYAVFSVVLFTDYYEEANNIIGQHQSMEIDPDTITGQWSNFEDGEYFVYTTGEMNGLCIIGNHEPCFSVSSFFSKNNEQFAQFSSLLTSLKARVEEFEKNNKGGEQNMEDLNNQVVTDEPVVISEPEANIEPEVTIEPEQNFDNNGQHEPENEVEPAAEPEVTDPEPEAEPTEFEQLQAKYDELSANYEAALARIQELEQFQAVHDEQVASLQGTIDTLNATITANETVIAQYELERKENLIKKFEKNIEAEEINTIRESMNNFSYDELESKLAIVFANNHLSDKKENKIPLPEAPEDAFASMMKKYRKN